MSEYQNRVDIDKIYDEFYDYTGKTRVVVFLENSKYRSISTRAIDDDGNTDAGTIDALMDYYGLDSVSSNLTALSNTVDGFISSIFDIIYPVGTLYHTTKSDFNPNDSFDGLWENISEDNDIYIWERVIETE
jgi:hypothetical protein